MAKITLTPSEITALLAGKAKPRSKNWWYDGHDVHNGKPPTGSIGSFQGRAGTMSRSRKGAVRRNPNGSRKYIIESTSVVAYKV